MSITYIRRTPVHPNIISSLLLFLLDISLYVPGAV